MGSDCFKLNLALLFQGRMGPDRRCVWDEPYARLLELLTCPGSSGTKITDFVTPSIWLAFASLQMSTSAGCLVKQKGVNFTQFCRCWLPAKSIRLRVYRICSE